MESLSRRRKHPAIFERFESADREGGAEARRCNVLLCC